MNFRQWTIVLAVISLAMACKKHEQDDTPTLLALFLGLGSGTATGYQWNLPQGFPTPSVPANNPMSEAKVRLGRHLFYDKRLSGGTDMACATCHIQNYAFSDGRQRGLGRTGQLHPRSPQHIVNVAYFSRITWANSTVSFLEDQAKAPMYGTSPVELGMSESSPEAIPRLQADSSYVAMFADAFGGDGTSAITDANIRKAIAAFERTIISGNSYYDRFERTGDASVLNVSTSQLTLNSAEVLAGSNLFNEEGGDCFHCHGGFNYADSQTHQGASPNVEYHNNALYSDAEYAAMTDNTFRGLIGATGLSSDIGRFRAATLRNIGVTHPFMHDGSLTCTGYVQPGNNTPHALSGQQACAEEALLKVVDHYAGGGKRPAATQDLSQPGGLSLNATEKTQLIKFLMSLTDPEFLTRESLSNPACGNPNFVSCP